MVEGASSSSGSTQILIGLPSLPLHSLRREKESQIFWSTRWLHRGNPSHIIVARSRPPTLESARWAPTSLEPGMAVSFPRSRARRSQLGLTTPVQWEEWGRPAPVNGYRCATKFHRIVSCVGRGTGLDRLDFGLQDLKPGTELEGERIAATGTAGFCSRNPCGIRTRDESTKRTHWRGWRDEHRWWDLFLCVRPVA